MWILLFFILSVESFRVHDIPTLSFDPTNQTTIQTFGNLSALTYHWTNDSFGWDTDGLRGLIFVNSNQVVIAFKGTSLTGNSSVADKVNDQLMFSCCCGSGSFLSSPVCNCATSKSTCSDECLTTIIRNNFDSYYWQGLRIYEEVRNLYPKSEIAFTGHSLGGAIAALVAYNTSNLGITFESPGVQLYAFRYGFPKIPNRVYNFGLSLDPIFLGDCEMCHLAGYLMETKCQLGYTCLYSIPGIENIYYHQIDVVVKYLNLPIPFCQIQNCTDCNNWKFN